MPLYRRLPKRGFSESGAASRSTKSACQRLQEAVDAGRARRRTERSTSASSRRSVVYCAVRLDGVRVLGVGELEDGP